jgi:patatin-like phospholipase/acyl hydrolase
MFLKNVKTKSIKPSLIKKLTRWRKIMRKLIVYLSIMTAHLEAAQSNNQEMLRPPVIVTMENERDRFPDDIARDRLISHSFLDKNQRHRERLDRNSNENLPINVLAIDGGGIRGVIPALILQKIEEQIGINTDDVFDLIFATSTGGLIASALTIKNQENKRIMSPGEIVKFYEEKQSDIFSQKCNCFGIKNLCRMLCCGSKYSEDALEDELLSKFDQRKLSACSTNVGITSLEIKSGKFFLFESYKARVSEHDNFKISSVCRATSAAPTFFSHFKTENAAESDRTKYTFIDGGVVANNPALDAYVRAQILFPGRKINLVSIGTGILNNQSDETSKIGGCCLVSWIPTLIDLILENQSIRGDEHLKQLAKVSGDKLNYFRLNPVIDYKQKDMDIADITTLKTSVGAQIKDDDIQKVVVAVKEIFQSGEGGVRSTERREQQSKRLANYVSSLKSLKNQGFNVLLD